MMDVFRIGTNSGVGIVSPVAGGGCPRPIGMVSLDGPPVEEAAAMAAADPGAPGAAAVEAAGAGATIVPGMPAPGNLLFCLAIW